MRRAKLGPDLTQMESEEVQAIFSSKDDPASRLHGLSARIFSQTMSISMDLVEQSRTINNRTMPPDKQSQDYKSAAERKELDLQQVQGELKAVQARCNKYIDLIRDNIQVECMKRPYTTNIKKWLAIAEECAGNGNDFLGMRIKGVMSELFDRSPEHKGILDASKIYKMLTNPNEGYFASSLFSGRYKAYLVSQSSPVAPDISFAFTVFENMADREKNFKNVLAVQKLLTKDEWESITSDMKGKTADKCKPLISEKLQAIGKNEQLEQIIAMLDKNKIDDFIGLNQVFGVAKQFFEKTDRFIEKMQNSVRQDLVNQAPEIGLKSPPHSRVGSMIGILPRARSSGRESASSLTRDSSVEGKSGSLLHSPSDASQSLGITASANDAIQPEPRSPAAVPRSVSQNVSSSDSSAMNARSPAPAGSSPAKFQLSRAKAAGRSSSAVIEEVLHQNSSSPRSSVSSEPRSPIAFIKDQLSQVGQNFDIGHAEYWVSAINAEIKGFRSPQTIDIVKMVKAYIEECKKNDPSLDVQALLDTINPFIPATSAKSPAEPVRGNPTEAGASQRDAVTASPPPPRKGLPPTPADIEQGASVGTPGIRRGRGDNK